MIDENFNIQSLPIIEKLQSNFSNVIDLLGENTEREGLVKTPERAAKAMKFLTSGYAIDPQEILKGAMFKEDYKEMVIVKDIELYSLCEHHMLPFFGKAHIAYISSGNVIGLSKMNRIVEYYAKRPQVQERLTKQIVKELQEALETDDVACVIDAKHLCVNSRGIKDVSSSTVTSEFGGKFKYDSSTKEEFLKYIQLDTSFNGI